MQSNHNHHRFVPFFVVWRQDGNHPRLSLAELGFLDNWEAWKFPLRRFDGLKKMGFDWLCLIHLEYMMCIYEIYFDRQVFGTTSIIFLPFCWTQIVRNSWLSIVFLPSFDGRRSLRPNPRTNGTNPGAPKRSGDDIHGDFHGNRMGICYPLENCPITMENHHF
jgi:hypothetical protein